MISIISAKNQTGPDLVHGWVSTDCGRGTIDILWTCLFTVFLCVWTAIHLPVPYYRGEMPLSMRDRIVRSKVVPALISIIAPEFLVWNAAVEFILARRSAKDLRRLINTELPLSHGYFLNMGGCCLCSPDGEYHHLGVEDVQAAVEAIERSRETPPFAVESPSSPDGDDFQFSVEHVQDAAEAFERPRETPSYLVENIVHDTRCRIPTRGSPDGSADQPKPLAEEAAAEFFAEMMGAPCCNEWVSQLSRISENQIESLAKSDTLSKLFACVQALWFVTEVISRLIKHQAVTLLEVSTTAYVLCAVIAYAAWWKKPQGCTMPLVIPCSDKAIAQLPPSLYASCVGTWGEFSWGGMDRTKAFSEDSSLDVFGFYLFMTLFGAIHVSSWNITLASRIELWMWRASSLYCLIIPPFGLMLYCVNVLMYRGELWGRRVTESMNYGQRFLYAIVRLFMIVETFASLRALPPSAYESVQWSSFIPHF